MSIQYLIDANVLVYAHEASDPKRRARAAEILERVGREPSAAVPAQALAEFSSVALRKLVPPVAPDRVFERIEAIERAFPVLPLTAAVVLEAVRGVRDHQLSYYDAQIWSVAKLAQIPMILSEDFQSGRVIEGVSFANPFAPSFDVEDL